MARFLRPRAFLLLESLAIAGVISTVANASEAGYVAPPPSARIATPPPVAPIASTPSAPPPAAGTSAPPASSDATPSAAPETPAAPLGLVTLVDTAPIGVDPDAATFVNAVLRQALVQMGYAVVPTPRMYEAARALALPFPVPPNGLATLMQSLSTPLAVTTELRANEGYYYATLRVRFATEPAERSRQLVATQWTLGDTLRSTLSALLAPPGTVAASAYTMGGPSPYAFVPQGGLMQPIQPRPSVAAHPQRFELAAFGVAAIGPGADSFVNGLVGARFAWLAYDRFGVTGSLAYANLRGRAGRVSNVLPMVGVETSVDVLPDLRVFLPLRVEAGYLPFNGPVFRVTAGASFSVSRTVRIEADVLQASLWLLPSSLAVSIDLGVQVIIGLGERTPTAATAPSPASETPGDSSTPRRRRRRRTRPVEEQPAAPPATRDEGPAGGTPAAPPSPTARDGAPAGA